MRLGGRGRGRVKSSKGKGSKGEFFTKPGNALRVWLVVAGEHGEGVGLGPAGFEVFEFVEGGDAGVGVGERAGGGLGFG